MTTFQSDEWDKRWLEVAAEAAKNSTCARVKVGALLVNNINLPMRMGWNVEVPRELRCDQGDCPRGLKSFDEQPEYAPYDDCVATHAEIWVTQGYEERGHEFTVYTSYKPCPDCTEHLTRYGFRVVYPEMV